MDGKIGLQELPQKEPAAPTAPKPAPKPSPPKPKGDMPALAAAMKKKLTIGNFTVAHTGFPRVEFRSDFGDCDIDEIKDTEIKIRCFVEKGFDSPGRLHRLVQNVTNVLIGKCAVNGHRLEVRYIGYVPRSCAGMRYATLTLGVRAA